MTREEAISLLSQVNHILVNSNSWLENTHEPLNIAFDMAIKALEQEPCEDAVSRQALIERINNAEENFKADHMESIASDDGDAFVDGVLSGVFNIREMVAQAPPITPTRKKGHWIITGDYLTAAYETIDYVKCSYCGEESLEEGDYCPNCGSFMRGEFE